MINLNLILISGLPTSKLIKSLFWLRFYHSIISVDSFFLVSFDWIWFFSFLFDQKIQFWISFILFSIGFWIFWFLINSMEVMEVMEPTTYFILLFLFSVFIFLKMRFHKMISSFNPIIGPYYDRVSVWVCVWAEFNAHSIFY